MTEISLSKPGTNLIHSFTAVTLSVRSGNDHKLDQIYSHL